MVPAKFLQGGGEMGELIRSFDWSKTPLGPPETWPQSLRTTVSILLNSKFPMFLFWGEDQISFYNDAFRPSLGNEGKHPAIGMTSKNVWPEIWHIIGPMLDKVMSGGAIWSEDQLIPIFRNGKIEDVYWTFGYSPVYKEDGDVGGVFVTCTETTKSVLGIQKLLISQQRFQNLVSQSPVGIIVLIGSEMRVEIVNDSYGRLIDRTTENLLGKNLFDIIPEAADPYRAILDKVRLTGDSVYMYDQSYFVYVNGQKKEGYINLVYQPYKEDDGIITGVMALCQDVTEQVIAKKSLQSSEERLRIALDAAELGSFELDYSNPDEMITSDRFNELFGFDHYVKRHEFASVIHPDDLFLRNHAHEQSLKTGRLFYEVRIIKENKRISWIRVVGKVKFNTEGKPEILLGILQDITKEKDLQDQKDNFIAMASHELKTPVTSIKAYAQILEQMFLQKGDHKEAEMVNRMDGQINKLNNLISDLLNITRINSGRLEYHRTSFDLNHLVNEIIEELQRTTVTHKFIVHPDADLTVHADRERIGQVITNFISNAIKYSPDSEVVFISTRLIEKEIRFCVKDHGIGIAEGSIDKVFELFYRVNDEKHQSFQGMGLGLYISSEIIKSEGGKIWVNSTVGKGSEFYFSLPVIKMEMS
ncbi:MAG: ATP-binding protein [Ginsengibacter sp.]